LSFLTIAATLTVPVAFPVTVAAVRAVAVGGIPFTVFPFSPATVPVPVSTIDPFAMVLTRRAVTLGVTVVVVRAVSVSTMRFDCVCHGWLLMFE
jgi:hypothetical protein